MKTKIIAVRDEDLEELTWLICTCANDIDNILPIQGLICEAFRSTWCWICYEYCLKARKRVPRYCRMEHHFVHFIEATTGKSPKDLSVETILKLWDAFKIKECKV